MYHMFDSRRNSGLTLVKMEVDPIETLKHLEAMRDDLAERLEQQLEGGLKSLKQVKENKQSIGNAYRGTLYSTETILKQAEKIESAIRSIHQNCFTTCHDPKMNDYAKRRLLQTDFPLKINPFSNDLAEEVIKGCDIIRGQLSEKREREARARHDAQSLRTDHMGVIQRG